MIYYLRHSLLSFFAILWLGIAPAHAIGGSAIVPYWHKSNNTVALVDVANVSSTTVNVSVKFYDTNGAAYTESSEGGSNFIFYGNFSGQDPVGNTASLSANTHGGIKIDSVGNNTYGYAVITWTSSGNEPVALVASAATDIHDGYGNRVAYTRSFIKDATPF